MKFKDIDQSKILWDMTPEKVFQSKEIHSGEEFQEMLAEDKKKVGYSFFYIDVWNCQGKLALSIFKESGSSSETIDDKIDSFSSEKIEEFMRRNNYHINMSGHYPIDNLLRSEIQRAFGASLLGRKGGSISSKIKTIKSAQNGKKGGRPKKKPDNL
jgi:hypothetical protein